MLNQNQVVDVQLQVQLMKLKKIFLYACTWISQHHISFPSNTCIP